LIRQESQFVNPLSLFSGAATLVGLYLASRYSYLLFHFLIEIFSVIVACGIFVIAWNSRRIMDNNYFLFVGIASLFVGAVDLFHALAYKGMGIFPENGPNLATQLWIVGRYLQSFSLLTASFFLGRNLRVRLVMMAFLVTIALLLAAIFGGIFPDCFVEGKGLTTFKKGSEYFVSFMLVGSLFFMQRKNEYFNRQVVRLISCAIALFIASELAFTFYNDVYGISNMVGHFLKLAGFFLIYKALIETGLVKPYDLLFRELKESEAKYRALFENMIDGFALHQIVVGESGKPVDYIYREVNCAFEKLTGLKAGDILNKHVTQAVPGIEKDPANWIGVYGEVALTGKELRFEQYSESLGKWYAVLAYCPIRNHFATVFEDITERKQAEDALKKLNEDLENRVAQRTTELAANIEDLLDEISERKIAEERVLRLNRLYAVLSETNQAIIRTMDRETIFIEFCRIAVEEGCFNLAWVGLVDEESGELKIVAAKGATGYLDNIRITIKEDPEGIGPTGIAIREGTYYICNDFLGSPVTRPWHDRARTHGLHASASIALKQDGRVIGALTLYSDKKDFFDQQQVELLQQMRADVSFALDNIVRETRRLEAERALLEESAERLRATEALREKEQMLIQQSRQASMGEMIGNIAHQWRQPLNTLGLYIQRMELFYDSGSFTRELLVTTTSESMKVINHMSQTIDDFRNYFTPNKEKTEFRVSEAIANTLSLLKGSLQTPEIHIETVAKNDPVIYGYQNEFAQVLLNLLINARDALIEKEINDPAIIITISSKDNCAAVTVADNAGGIPEEIMGKIFDPYFTTKGPQQGTGVGLFMSKSIIEKNMAGRLSVRNIADGAEFRIEVRNGNKY
jgi:PAS domain S-box-containing protein